MLAMMLSQKVAAAALIICGVVLVWAFGFIAGAYGKR